MECHHCDKVPTSEKKAASTPQPQGVAIPKEATSWRVGYNVIPHGGVNTVINNQEDCITIGHSDRPDETFEIKVNPEHLDSIMEYCFKHIGDPKCTLEWDRQWNAVPKMKRNM
jgi:hypothetical protein